jgi:hypothetical protein
MLEEFSEKLAQRKHEMLERIEELGLKEEDKEDAA